jgi:hypothetical protein
MACSPWWHDDAAGPFASREFAAAVAAKGEGREWPGIVTAAALISAVTIIIAIARDPGFQLEDWQTLMAARVALVGGTMPYRGAMGQGHSARRADCSRSVRIPVVFDDCRFPSGGEQPAIYEVRRVLQTSRKWPEIAGSKCRGVTKPGERFQ